MISNKLQKRKEKAALIIKVLKKIYPHPEMALNYSNNLELLISVILSAQCTDKKVNEVTAVLFKKYPTLEDYLGADLKEFENDIKKLGLFRSKAKNILSTAKIIKENFKETVPNTMQNLLVLPGVARKTANVVLGNAFGKSEGIAVDTHVRRLANLHGLTESQDPKKIEQDLMQIFDKEEWINITHRLILYGRDYCPARKHDHSKCPLCNI